MRFATVKEIREAIASGRTTAVEVTKAVLADIKERDGKIGAFLETFDHDALAQAAEVDAKIARGESVGALAGVPVAVKDNILVQGHAATAGSKMLAEYTAAYSATVVDRLRAADAVIVGRTNMDEFAFGSSTENSAWQVTRNPWNTEKIPGGTSGGSAAAVAAGFVPLALGTDTGGSIRLPGALCGVVGVKPSYGRVSRYGVIADVSSFDQVGPLTHTAEDAALAMRVIEGRDAHDSTTLDAVKGKEVTSFKGLRVGVPKEYFVDGMDADVRATIEQAIARMKDAGAEIIDISLPLTPHALAAYYVIQPAEASSNLARFDGMRYGTRGEGNLEESYLRARSEGFAEESKRRIILGTFVLSAGYFDAYYKKALAIRAMIRDEFDAAFAKVDVIVGPTSPIPAWNIGEKMDDPMAMYLTDVFTVAASLAGICGVSVPCGFAKGLPVGMQLLAGAMQDDVALGVAMAWQEITNEHTKTPNV